MKTEFDVLIIGAGMAGLSAACYLDAAGKKVGVLEKSHNVGGRMSTRVKDSLQWDHGAQYFTAQSPAFKAQLAEWISEKVAAPWDSAVGAWDGEALRDTKPTERWVGVPFMRSPLQFMARNLSIQLNTQVTSVAPTKLGWQVKTELRDWCAKQLIVAIPAQQAQQLLPQNHCAREVVENVMMEPCWAVMLSAESRFELPFASVFVNVGPLGWVAQDNTKPSRNLHNASIQTWVLHATPEWSQENLEKNADEVASILAAEFSRLLALWVSQSTPPVWTLISAHRWRYARGSVGEPNSTVLATQTYSGQRDSSLVLAGDWLMGGRVEGAYLSGIAAAKQMMEY